MAKSIQLPDFSTFEKIVGVFGDIDEFNRRMVEMREILQQIEHRYQDVLRGQEIESARATALQALNDAKAVKAHADREAKQIREELDGERRALVERDHELVAKQRDADALLSDVQAKRGRLDAELARLEKQLEETASLRAQLLADRETVAGVRAELDDKQKKVHQLLG